MRSVAVRTRADCRARPSRAEEYPYGTREPCVGRSKVMSQIALGFARRPSVSDLEIPLAQACHAVAGRDGLKAAKRWDRVKQNGYSDFSELACLTAFRDVLGLNLPSHEDFALPSGFRADAGR